MAKSTVSRQTVCVLLNGKTQLKNFRKNVAVFLFGLPSTFGSIKNLVRESNPRSPASQKISRS